MTINRLSNRIGFLVLFILLAVAAPQRGLTAEVTGQNYVFRRSWGNEGNRFNNPDDVTIGLGGLIYVADSGNHRIVIINSGDRTFSSWGGNGIMWGKFENPSGIATDSSGNVYVADTGNHRIQKFNSSGVYLAGWGAPGNSWGEFLDPSGIATDSSGKVYVADTGNDRIQKFNRNGFYMSQWGSNGSGAGQFNSPDGVTTDNNGNVYVADTGNNRIQKFDSNGQYLIEWGTSGSGMGQFNDPDGVTTDNNGNVYVADSGNNRIQMFSSNGDYLDQWGSYGNGPGQFDSPGGIATNNSGDLYVADSSNNRIQKFDSNGAYLTEWGSSSSGPGQFSYPRSMATDVNSNIYVTDWRIPRILKFTNSGAYLTEWGSYGSGPGQFNQPSGIATDSSGNVYVADSGNDRIQKFNNNGAYLTQWGGLGTSGPGKLALPLDVATDSIGNVYVVDHLNERVVKFTNIGNYITEWVSYSTTPNTPYFPERIATDISGNVFVLFAFVDGVDRLFFHIEKFNNIGEYQTECCYGQSDAYNFYSGGIATDSSGNIYFGAHHSGNPHIQKFNNDGSYLTEWGSFGNGPGQFNHISGIATDNNSNVYVGDVNRIQVFSNVYPLPDPLSGLVRNGSFEQTPALTEWNYGGTLPVTLTNQANHGGAALQLGEFVPPQPPQGLSEAWAHQTLYVDPAWERPLLTFDYRLFVNDTVDFSDFFVAIQDGVGSSHLATVLRDGFRYCLNPSQAPFPATDLGWRSASYNLSAFKGQYIRIVFANRNLWPNSWGIWSYVDDVRVVDAGPLPPLPFSARIFFPFFANEANQHCDTL